MASLGVHGLAPLGGSRPQPGVFPPCAAHSLVTELPPLLTQSRRRRPLTVLDGLAPLGGSRPCPGVFPPCAAHSLVTELPPLLAQSRRRRPLTCWAASLREAAHDLDPAARSVLESALPYDRRMVGRTGRTPTLEDVARVAGVSRATVSRVVNGIRNVDADIQEAVRRAIEKTGYAPNRAARSLVTRRAGAVALVVSGADGQVFGDPFFGRV